MKKRYYKNGNPAAYKDFSERQWAGISERDKAMWTPYSENEPAPIPQEVIDFTNENPVPCCKENKQKELEAEVEALKKQLDEVMKDAPDEVAPPEPPTEDEEKDAVKARLTELGVPFRANTGLKKLKEKLELAEDANNTE